MLYKRGVGAGVALSAMLFVSLLSGAQRASDNGSGGAPVASAVERSSRSSISVASTAPTTRPRVAEGEGFANPLDVIIADPFIYREGKTYYLYGTSGGTLGTQVWSSENLIDWRGHGYAFRKTDDAYSRRHFWAPEMFKHRDKYYLHFTASSEKTTLRLVLCEADSPIGPFREVKAPWFESKYAVIDGNVFRDDDGELYLYYVLDCSENQDSEIYVRRLTDNLIPEIDPTFCVKPSQKWEGTTWNEAPFVMKHNGLYYLMYSSNYFGEREYSVGYATASSPMGPWTKYADNPILSSVGPVSGPGHNSVIDSPDGRELFMVYHSHQQTNGQGWHRQLALDRMRFVKESNDTPDRIVVDGPTMSLQPMPSGAVHAPAATSDLFSGPLNRRQWMIMSELPSNWRVADGRLEVVGVDGDIAGDRADVRNLFFQYAPAGDFDVSTKLTIDPKADYEQAFITIFQDHNRFIKAGAVWSRGGPKLEFGVDDGGVYKFELTKNTFGDSVHIRVARRGNSFSVHASGNGTSWIPLKENFEFNMVDTKIGIAACSPGSERPVKASFDYFRITPASAPAR